MGLSLLEVSSFVFVFVLVNKVSFGQPNQIFYQMIKWSNYMSLVLGVELWTSKLSLISSYI